MQMAISQPAHKREAENVSLVDPRTCGFWKMSFKEAFCHHCGCEQQAYEWNAVRALSHSYTRPFGFILNPLHRSLLPGATAFIQRAGQARRLQDLLNDFHDYHAWVDLNGGLLEKRLRFRISGRRLLTVVRQLFNT